MSHESFHRLEDAPGSSNRSFGLVFAAVFGLVALLPLIHGGAIRWWALAVCGAFLLVALAFPARLARLNRAWQKLGHLLHLIVSPLVLGILFFLVIAPTGLLLRAFGKDPLRLKRDALATTYWIERQPPGPAPESLRNQF